MSTLSWLHFGDLHVTADDGYESLRRFEALIVEANRHLRGAVDFAVLPGDNANNGTVEQYQGIRCAIDALEIPLHIIPGDHDFEPGSLDLFHSALGAERLPKSVEVKGARCLFLDVVSAGEGGPDFRLCPDQDAWLRAQLDAARRKHQRSLVFMHAYPGDLAEDGEGIGHLFAEHRVAFVDTGHTHYNELLNDGRVIYAATRSTGQIEEDGGQPGFSVGTLDGTAISWRFKTLQSAWPWVVITSPADHRLTTDGNVPVALRSGDFEVRAKVFGDRIEQVVLKVPGRPDAPMQPHPHEPSLWSATSAKLDRDAQTSLTVEARGAGGQAGSDRIVLAMEPAEPRQDSPPGTDAHALGAWPEHGLLGTQLGPNKNGREWR